MTSILNLDKNSTVDTGIKSNDLYDVSTMECSIKPLEVNVRIAAKSSKTMITDFFKPANNQGKNIAFLLVGNKEIKLSEYDRKALIASKGEIVFQNNAYTFHYNGFDTVTAYCLQTLEEVGEIKFNQKEDDVYTRLDYIEVKHGYQRLGIGTNLVKAALMIEPDLQIAFNTQMDNKYPTRVASGYALVKHCAQIGLLSSDRNLLNAENILTDTESRVERLSMCL